jgi:hypothetical protein
VETTIVRAGVKPGVAKAVTELQVGVEGVVVVPGVVVVVVVVRVVVVVVVVGTVVVVGVVVVVPVVEPVVVLVLVLGSQTLCLRQWSGPRPKAPAARKPAIAMATMASAAGAMRPTSCISATPRSGEASKGGAFRGCDWCQ